MYLSVFYLITCVFLLYISETKYSQQRGGGASGTILGIFILLSMVGGGIGLYYHFKSDASPSITPSPTNSVENKQSGSHDGSTKNNKNNGKNKNNGHINPNNPNYDVGDLLELLKYYGAKCTKENIAKDKSLEEVCNYAQGQKKVDVEHLLKLLAKYGMKKPTPSPQ